MDEELDPKIREKLEEAGIDDIEQVTALAKRAKEVADQMGLSSEQVFEDLIDAISGQRTGKDLKGHAEVDELEDEHEDRDSAEAEATDALRSIEEGDHETRSDD